ncbi:MAG: type II toxin-antitoxin system VapC family toxin [Firmicutes bacterium]|nr:type II toxin-antitoxin system VapC family toxin [Bacillota bacterium]
MIYLDSSALVKLVRFERETPSLLAWLRERASAPLVSSFLAEVEVARAVRRYDPTALVNVPGVMARLYRMEIDARIRAMAAAYDDANLRSLDAIHLATAELLALESQELQAFVAYDERLVAAAKGRHLVVAMPGRPLSAVSTVGTPSPNG